MHLIIYTGKQNRIIVKRNSLSKLYALEKNIPVVADSKKDRNILMAYTENVKGGCCNQIARWYPIESDNVYCEKHNVNLLEFRKKWIAELTKPN